MMRLSKIDSNYILRLIISQTKVYVNNKESDKVIPLSLLKQN